MNIQPPASSLTPDQMHVIHSGSWSVAGFSWIYLLAMKLYKDALILFLLGFLPVVNLVASIYYIINGKKLAWASRTWQGFDDFLACQRIWDRWSKILIGILVGFAVLGILLAILFPLFLAGSRL